jgi:hypothetical protein
MMMMMVMMILRPEEFLAVLHQDTSVLDGRFIQLVVLPDDY